MTAHHLRQLMSAYPATERGRRISREKLRSRVGLIFEACGMAAVDAALVADTLVWADLAGIHAQGVVRVPEHVAALRHGKVSPSGKPSLLNELGAALLIDGGNAMGQLSAALAMSQAIDRAATHGIALGVVRGGSDSGVMAYYVRMAVRRGMIGIAGADALSSPSVSVGIPAANERPLVFDPAFGPRRTWSEELGRGPALELGLALEELSGPRGGYRDPSWAVVMGMISSLLSSAVCAGGLGDGERGPWDGGGGCFYVAVEAAAFADPRVFRKRVDALVRRIRSSKRSDGKERVHVPGELEAETEERRRAEGIPLRDETWAALAATERELELRE